MKYSDIYCICAFNVKSGEFRTRIPRKSFYGNMYKDFGGKTISNGYVNCLHTMVIL